MLPLGHMVAGCGGAWLVKQGVGERSPNPLARLFDSIDYRFVAIGAVLPDLVDKPLIWFILRDTETYGGHHFGHSLVFALGLLLLGSAVGALGENRVFLLAIGALSHVLLDSVTRVPWSLLYPFIEVEADRYGLLPRVTDTGIEIVLLALLLWAVSRAEGRRWLLRLVREGRVD